jgi:hypothetical protein
MPNPYSGRIIDSTTGTPLSGVEIRLRYTNPPGQSILLRTTTIATGIWNLVVPDGVDISTVEVTYVRTGFNSFSIKNPPPTTNYTFPPPAINPVTGGTFRFQGGFDSGKYLVSSLDPYDVGLLNYNLAGAAQFLSFWGTTGSLLIKASESTVPNYDREPSASNGTPNRSFGAALPRQSLSDKRADNLEAYVNQYFNNNGLPAPDLRKLKVVEGPDPYDPTIPLSTYKKSQYVTIGTAFTVPPCRTIAFSSSLTNTVTFTKPPGVTAITIDALDLPDRFGFSPTNNSATITYTNTYYQRLSTVGSLISWGFIIFLQERLNPSGIPGAITYPLVLNGSNSNGNLRQSLLDDWFIQSDGTTSTTFAGSIGAQIITYNNEFARRQGNLGLLSGFREDPTKHINFCFGTLQGAQVVGYNITRGDLVFSLNGVLNNNPFIIAFIQGNVQGNSGPTSRWKYRLC